MQLKVINDEQKLYALEKACSLIFEGHPAAADALLDEFGLGFVREDRFESADHME